MKVSKKLKKTINQNLNRRGRMAVHVDTVKSAYWPSILAQAEFVPFRVEHHFATSRFEYVGCSPMFRELEQSEELPVYNLHYRLTDDGSVEIYGVYEE